MAASAELNPDPIELSKLLEDERAERIAAVDACHQVMLGTLIALSQEDAELRSHEVRNVMLYLNAHPAFAAARAKTEEITRNLEDDHVERQ